MQIRLPQSDGSLRTLALKAMPVRPAAAPSTFNRVVYAAAHVVVDPSRTPDPWGDAPAVDWDATLAFREHLYGLGFRVAEAMDTSQRGMGVGWPVARELIRRSLRHAKSAGGVAACGVGTDQLAPGPGVTVDAVERAWREQLDVVQAEGGQAILMASRALAKCARGAADYLELYARLLRDAERPVILHWLGTMFDPELQAYWGSDDIPTALETVAELIARHAGRIDGIKVSLLDARWEVALRARLPSGVKMYTGDDFNYAELIEGADGHVSHGLLGIFDPIAPVAAAALEHLAAGRPGDYRALLDPTVALSRELFRAPTMYYKAGVVFLAWLNGHQRHFSMAGGMQSARGVTHYARVFELADACGALSDPELACDRMRRFLDVAAGVQA